ncbi:NAD(P)-dependent oxidoreductase [Candidatus Gottesmanbacteria bacterium]|nr:NAD(P)-dependent oxidoreductase [Candidatus Gottesmanbacteria bacterium]
MKTKKIAITGATGFLGAHVMQLFQQESVTTSFLKKETQDLFIPQSLSELLIGASAVVHLAGANRDTNYKLAKVNLLGTVRLMEAMRLYCPKAALIFASSVQAAWKNSFYGWSKRCAEEVIGYESRSRGMRAVVLRFSNLYGPGGRPFYNSAISTFAHLIQSGKPIVVHGDGKQIRDYLYVKDAALAIFRSVMYRGVEICPVIDVCSGERVSINGLIHTMSKLVGKEISVSYAPSPNKESVLPICSFSRASQILGWEPTTLIYEGLGRTLGL